MLKAYDLSNKDFGFLHVIELDIEKSQNRRKNIWKCRCKCGKITYVTTNKLVKHITKSCGCIIDDMNFKSKRGGLGVSFRKASGTYRARIQRYKKAYNLGSFSSYEDAMIMVKMARTFTTMDSFLNWYSVHDEIFNTFKNVCEMFDVNALLIAESIYNIYYEEAYSDLERLKTFIVDWKDGYYS